MATGTGGALTPSRSGVGGIPADVPVLAPPAASARSSSPIVVRSWLWHFSGAVVWGGRRGEGLFDGGVSAQRLARRQPLFVVDVPGRPDRDPPVDPEEPQDLVVGGRPHATTSAGDSSPCNSRR